MRKRLQFATVLIIPLTLLAQLPTFIGGSGGSGGGGGGTVTSTTCGNGLTGGTFTISGTCAVDLTNANSWTNTQTFSPQSAAPGTVFTAGNNPTGNWAGATNIDLSGGFNWSPANTIWQTISTAATASRVFALPDANSNSVIPSTCATGQTVTAISSGGVITCTTTITTTTPGTSTTLSGAYEIYVCTSTCTVTVPVPAANVQYCVVNDDNVSTVITLSAIGSSSRYENQARTAYGTAGTGTMVSGGAVKDAICIVGRDATHYLTLTATGTWTAN